MTYLRKIKRINNLLSKQSLLVGLMLLLAACVPQHQIEVTITGLDTETQYTELPSSIVFDYTNSANTLEASTMANEVSRLQVLINSIDVTEHVTFGAQTATFNPAASSTITNYLNNGKNVLTVQQTAIGNPNSIPFEITNAIFNYTRGAPVVIIKESTPNGSNFDVSGYVLSTSPITAMTINGTAATVTNNTFSVTVASSTVYDVTATNAIGLSTNKQYRTLGQVINDGVRVRVHEEFIDQQALYNVIQEAISNQTIELSEEVLAEINPVQKIGFFSGINLASPLEMGQLQMNSIAFVNNPNAMQIDLNMDILNTTARVKGFGILGLLDTRATPDTLSIDMRLNVGVTPTSNLDITIDNMDIDIDGLTLGDPANGFDVSLLAPIMGGLIGGAVQSKVEEIFDDVRNNVQLAALVDLGALNIDGAVTTMKSIPENGLVDTRLSFTPTANVNTTLGALYSGTSVSDPAISSLHNFGISISQDVINQSVTSAYVSNNPNMGINLYVLGGTPTVLPAEPADSSLKDLDMRIYAGLKAAPEMSFSSQTDGGVAANIELPLMTMDIDMRLLGAWTDIFSIDVYATGAGGAHATEGEIRITVDAEKINFDVINSNLGTLGQDTGAINIDELIELGLTFIKPQLAKLIEEIGLIQLTLPGLTGLDNMELVHTGGGNLEVRTKINYADIFNPPTQP